MLRPSDAALLTRVAILADALLDGEQPVMGIRKLLALVGVLMTCVDDSASRALVAQELRAEADILAASDDRRSLH